MRIAPHNFFLNVWRNVQKTDRMWPFWPYKKKVLQRCLNCTLPVWSVIIYKHCIKILLSKNIRSCPEFEKQSICLLSPRNARAFIEGEKKNLPHIWRTQKYRLLFMQSNQVTVISYNVPLPLTPFWFEVITIFSVPWHFFESGIHFFDHKWKSSAKTYLFCSKMMEMNLRSFNLFNAASCNC